MPFIKQTFGRQVSCNFLYSPVNSSYLSTFVMRLPTPCRGRWTPHPRFSLDVYTVDYTHTPQVDMRRFITYIIEVSGESRAGHKWLEKARREVWPGFLLWLGDGTEMRASLCWKGLMWFNSPASAKGVTPRLSYQFVQIVHRREKKGWGLESSSVKYPEKKSYSSLWF